MLYDPFYNPRAKAATWGKMGRRTVSKSESIRPRFGTDPPLRAKIAGRGSFCEEDMTLVGDVRVGPSGRRRCGNHTTPVQFSRHRLPSLQSRGRGDILAAADGFICRPGMYAVNRCHTTGSVHTFPP